MLTLLNESTNKDVFKFKEYIAVPEKDIRSIIQKLKKEGYVDEHEHPEGEKIVRRFFHTNKVKPNMLDHDLSYKRKFGSLSQKHHTDDPLEDLL